MTRELREYLGLTRREFSEKVGAASKRTVENWEQGRRQPNRKHWREIEKLIPPSREEFRELRFECERRG